MNCNYCDLDPSDVGMSDDYLMLCSECDDYYCPKCYNRKAEMCKECCSQEATQ